MSLYFGTTEITNIDNLVPQTGLDITDIWFGSTNVYTVWKTYEVTLPATFNANGSDLRQYQVFGNVGGVGDRTENLYNKNNASMNFEGYINNTTYTVVVSTVGSLSIIVPVEPNTTYTVVKPATTRFRLGLFTSYPNVGNVATAIYGDRNGDGVDYGTSLTFTTSNNTSYILAFIRNYADLQTTNEQMKNSTMVLKGSAIPEFYIPYGYKLDMVSRTENLLEITQDMYNPENWDWADPYQGKIYYMYYRLPQGVIDSWQNIGTIAGTVYLKPNGSYYTGTVFIVTNLKGGEGTRPITKDYRLLTTNGEILNFSKDVSTWSDIYLGIGYSGGLTLQNKQTVIDELFGNYNIMLNSGSTALPYEPYSNTTTPIYIGNEPLGKDEYADYQAQKVYRMIDGTLTPTDPPVPLPALPTVEGETVVDYAGQSVAPEKVLLKYRKEEF